MAIKRGSMRTHKTFTEHLNRTLTKAMLEKKQGYTACALGTL